MITEQRESSKEKINQALNKIIGLFKTGNVPEAVAIVTFPPLNVPMCRWSLGNRILAFGAGTSDARGYRQWQEVGRQVKTGEKAFFILAPRMVKKEEQEKDPEYFLAGFLAVPVFAAVQTSGEPLQYENNPLPNFPLLEKAKSWGIEVVTIPGQNYHFGYFQPDKNRICLATPQETIFFHELAHAAQYRIDGVLKREQDPKQEIIAELSAQVLALFVGTEIKSTLGNAYGYIFKYAQKEKRDIGKACLSVLGTVEKVLAEILS